MNIGRFIRVSFTWAMIVFYTFIAFFCAYVSISYFFYQ
jgi:hypothetical protein